MDESFRSNLLLEIAKKRKVTSEKIIKEIKDRFRYFEPSPSDFSNYLSYLQIFGEEHVLDAVARAVSTFSDTILFKIKECNTGHLKEKDGKLIASPELEKLLVSQSKNGFIGAYRWYVDEGLERKIKFLEALGINLHNLISRREALKILRNAPVDKCFHLKDGSLDLSKPATLVLNLASTNKTARKNTISTSKGITFFCNYFNLSIPKGSEKKLWGRKLKPRVDKTSSEERKFEISCAALPKEGLLKLVGNNTLLLKLIANSNLLKHETQPRKAVKALFDQFSDARIPITNNVMQQHQDRRTMITELLYEHLGPARFYRITSLLYMMAGQIDYRSTKYLKEFMLRFLKKENEPSQIDSSSNESIDHNLRETLSRELSLKSYWGELKNELDALNEEDLRILSVIFCEGLYLRLAFGKELSDKYFENTSNESNTFMPTRSKNNGLIEKIIHAKKTCFYPNHLENFLTSSEAKEMEIQYLSKAGDYFVKGEELAHKINHDVNINYESILRKAFIPFSFLSGDSDIKSHSHGGDFNSFREYTPGDDPRLINWKSSARSEKIYINKKEDSIHSEPRHFVLDIEWLKGGVDSSDEILLRVRNLVSIFYSGLVKNKDQHLHLFYRGSHLISLKPDELKDLLSHKEVEDNFGKRNKLIDFILQLNYLGESTAVIKRIEAQNNFTPAPFPISHENWMPEPEKGTAFVLSDNPDLLKKSIDMFKKWQDKGIDVRRVRLAA